jgi:hypothetical protein
MAKPKQGKGKNGKKKGRNGNGKSRKGGGGGKRSGPAFSGIVQGAGRSVAMAFGSEGGNPRQGLDAFHPAHLSLPRAVGPYTVTRTTQIIDTNNACTVFGTAWLQAGAAAGAASGSHWSPMIGASGVVDTNPINAAGNTHIWSNSTAVNYRTATLCPSAMSVQVMNPNAVGVTRGMVYAGRARTQMRMNGSTMTWTDLMNDLVAYNAPRLMSAGKLAFRGVQIDCVPFNMNLLADFMPFSAAPTNPATWDSPTMVEQMGGFAPIFIYNPNNIELQFLVTMEWRTRFDPSNPAQASHRQHPVSSDKTWGDLLTQLDNGANGVRDIASSVAATGAAAQTAMQSVRGAIGAMGGARNMLALM